MILKFLSDRDDIKPGPLEYQVYYIFREKIQAWHSVDARKRCHKCDRRWMTAKDHPFQKFSFYKIKLFKIIKLKEMKEELINRKDILCSWFGRLNMFKMAIIPNLIYRYDVIPVKIPAAFLAEFNKLILRFIWKYKEPRVGKTVWKNLHKARAIKMV